MNQDPEDEWEYIFDENETQTFFLTVDLSATSTGTTTGTPGKSTKTNDEQNDEQNEEPINTPSEPATNADTNEHEQSSVQFLDLPNKAPYISYKGQIFTGTWGQTLGSDMIFAASNDVPEDVEPVMQNQDHQWCLLGVSNTTLVAKRMELTKRNMIQAPSFSDPTVGVSASETPVSHTESSAQHAKPFSIVLKADTDLKQKRQAAYLERLMAIKIAKGEKDVVYMGRAAKYIDAAGKVKKGMHLSKHERDEIDGNQNGGISSRPRKQQRREVSSNQSLPMQVSQDNVDREDGIGHDNQDAAGHELQEPQDEAGDPESNDEAEDDLENQGEDSDIGSSNGSD